MCYFYALNFLFHKEILLAENYSQKVSLISAPPYMYIWCFSHKQVALTFFPFESAESKTNLANKRQRERNIMSIQSKLLDAG